MTQAYGVHPIDGMMDIDHPIPCPPERLAGLNLIRHICDVLEENPELPNVLSLQYQSIWSWDYADVLGMIKKMRRAFGGTWEKRYDSDSFKLERRDGDVLVILSADRESVCERVVVGSREVEVEEYDAEALAEVPRVTVIREEDVVEWRCPDVI